MVEAATVYDLISGSWVRYDRSDSGSASRFMVGVATTGVRGGTASTEQSTMEGWAGYQAYRRCYGGATNWKTSPYWLQSFLGAVDVNTGTSKSIRTTHISWNPDCEALCSENPSGFDPTGLQAYIAAGETGSALAGYGTETRNNLIWLLSCPAYAQCIWTPWHEADGNIGNSSGGYNWTSVAHFKLGLQIICDMVHTFANPLWQTCLVLDAYVWKGNSGSALDPVNFWPGSGYIDIMGIDNYNEGSVLTSPRWDSCQAGLGYPADSNEVTAYTTAYGGTGGYKTTDSSGLTWSHGFLGWCEMMGVTKWLMAEFGTQENFEGLTPTWPSTTASRIQWINDAVTFINGYNLDATKNATCIGINYFMRGRLYAGPSKLSKAVRLTSTGARQVCIGSASSSSALPSSGNTTGDLRFVFTTSTDGHVWRWSGSAWTDQGAALMDSWELWNPPGLGLYDDSSTAEATWAAVTVAHTSRAAA